MNWSELHTLYNTSHLSLQVIVGINDKKSLTWGSLSRMPAVWIHSQPTILRSTSVSKSNPSIIDGVDVSFSLGNSTLLSVNNTLVGCCNIGREWWTSVAVVVAAVSILHITHYTTEICEFFVTTSQDFESEQ